MSCECKDVEVYDYLTNSTVALEVCSNVAHCNYLATGFVSVIVFMMFLLCCLLTADTRSKRHPRVAYVHVDAEEDEGGPPQYNTV